MMKEIINWIIEQELQFLDDYPALVLPIAEEFEIEVSCAQSIVDTVVEWERDSSKIDSLEERLNKRFPDIVIK